MTAIKTLLLIRPLCTSLLFASLIWFAACSGARPPIESSDQYQISEITLERSGSWGLRSGYRLVLRKDGSAEYTGDIHAKRAGKYHGAVSSELFGPLTKVIVENDYLLLKDKYHALVTDTDTVTTSIVFSGGRKTVEDFGRGGGEGLTRIEQAIDKVAEQIAWIRDDT